MSKDSPICQAIRICGGQGQLAEKAYVDQRTVSHWKVTGTVPAKRVLAVEAATGGKVTRYQLRPDIYGPDPAEEARAA